MSMSHESAVSKISFQQPRSDTSSGLVSNKAEDRMLELIEREQLPGNVKDTLAGALTGDLTRQQLLFQAMIDTWPRLQKALTEVKRAVRKAPWQIEPYKVRRDKTAKPEAIKRAELLEDLFWITEPRPAYGEISAEDLISEVVYGYYTGVHVVETYWEESSLGVKPRAYKSVPARFYGYPFISDDNSEDRLMFNRDGGFSGYDYEDFPEHHFLLSMNSGHPGHLTVAAPLRALTGYWLAANFGLKWLLNFTQLYGIPFRWAEYEDNNVKGQVCNMLESIGSAGYGAFPKGTKLNFVEARKGAEQLPQKMLIEMADTQCDIFILGQTLTTSAGDKGSQALGNVHNSVKQEVIEGVCDHVEDVLNRQLVPSIMEVNYGNRENLPQFNAAFEREQDEKAMAERDAILLAAGIPMSRKQLNDRHKLKEPENEEDVVGGQSPQPESIELGDLSEDGAEDGTEGKEKGGSVDAVEPAPRDERLLALWAQRVLRLADSLAAKGFDKRAKILQNKVFQAMGLNEIQAAYNPDQERAPAGSQNGGQWVNSQSTKTNTNDNGEGNKNGNSEEEVGVVKNPNDEGRIHSAIQTRDGDGRLPEQRAHSQRERLRELAESHPELLVSSPAVSDVPETGEHIIEFTDDVVRKYTKGTQYGFHPTADFPDIQNMSVVKIGLVPASPQQYLKRIELHNKIFNDDIKLLGITKGGGLAISQPRIRGRAATRVEIEKSLKEIGFEKVPESKEMMSGVLSGTSYYNPKEKVLVVDARPANFIMDSDGEAHAIDVMITPTDSYLEALLNEDRVESANAEELTVESLSESVLEGLTGVTVDWLAPVKPIFLRLGALAMSETVSDEDFITALEKAQTELPELFDVLDTEALETAFTDAISTGVIAGSADRYIA